MFLKKKALIVSLTVIIIFITYILFYLYTYSINKDLFSNYDEKTYNIPSQIISVQDILVSEDEIILVGEDSKNEHYIYKKPHYNNDWELVKKENSKNIIDVKLNSNKLIYIKSDIYNKCIISIVSNNDIKNQSTNINYNDYLGTYQYGNYIYVVSRTGNFYKINTTNYSVKNYNISKKCEINEFGVIDENNIYYLSNKGNKYNLDNGSSKVINIDKQMNLKSYSDKYTKVINSNLGAFIQDNIGLYKILSNEILIKSNLYSFSEFNNDILKIQNFNSNFYILYRDIRGIYKIGILKYHFFPIRNKKSRLNIASMNNNDIIRYVSSRYNEKNNSIAINHIILKNNIKKNFSTEIKQILKDSQVDLIITDGINIKFLEKLKFKKVKENNKIANFLKKRSSINTIPLGFRFYGLYSNNNTNDYLNLNLNKWFFIDYERVIYKNFFNNKDMNNLEKNEIKSYYIMMLKIFDMSVDNWYTKGISTKPIDSNIYEDFSISNQLIASIGQNGKFDILGEVFDLQDYQILNGFKKINSNNSDTTSQFLVDPILNIGIIDKNQSMASSFIDFSLSKDIQREISIIYKLFPASNDLLIKIHDEKYLNFGGEIGESDQNENMNTIKLDPLSKDDIDKLFYNLNNSTITNINDDDEIRNIIHKGLSNIISGEFDINESIEKTYSEYKSYTSSINNK